MTHLPMRNTRQRPYLLRSASNPYTSWSVASLNISRTVLASASVSAVAVVVMSTGQALGCESHSDHAAKGCRLVVQALHDLQGVLDYLWWVNISTLSNSYLKFCAPGCAQNACTPLLHLSSGAQLYCRTNSKLDRPDILPGLLSH